MASDPMADLLADNPPFAVFARLYPHEAYERDPEAFVAYVQSVEPGITREQIMEVLAETGGKDTPCTQMP